MFADENNFFSSSSIGTSDFLSSEPRKSLGGLGSHAGTNAFGASDDMGAPAESFSQEPTASQRGTAPPGGLQTPDGCVCATVGMLRRAVKTRTSGGTLRLNGRDVGIIGLCGRASGLDTRASMFKFSLEDTTGQIDVECSNKGALSDLREGAEAPEKEAEASPASSRTGLAAALEGGIVTVYGFPCTDDKGEVYIDCFKVNAISDMREYVELFPLRIIAGALQEAVHTGPITSEPSMAGVASAKLKEESDGEGCTLAAPFSLLAAT